MKKSIILTSLAHPLLVVVVSFQIHFLVDFTMQKTLRHLRCISAEGFLAPKYWCSGPLSCISPIKVNGRLQDWALSDCLVFLAPWKLPSALATKMQQMQMFPFQQELCGMVILTRICLFRACKKRLVSGLSALLRFCYFVLCFSVPFVSVVNRT